ncbi:MAG: ribonuclease [Gallionellaceae bacterium]|nr:ribonuclease [Gallionellaceae bacterium]
MLRSVQALWILFGLLLCLPVQGEQPAHRVAALAFVSTAELPPEARDTLRLIKQGGPFPYARDGVVFGNYGKLLPSKPRGYYREYTVITPGVRNRGARRIVCGVFPECYYTTDHYRTFQRIRE